MDMKLNKYIHSKMLEVEYEALPWSEEDIEQWIIDWYMDTFKEINMGETAGEARRPPLWLAGPRWYDRRDRKIKEAKEAEEAEIKAKEIEARSYEKDE
tara:strand:+ start:34 stop:327 length:294 start_codon:yes stop_codon:yes gene_type:complete